MGVEATPYLFMCVAAVLPFYPFESIIHARTPLVLGIWKQFRRGVSRSGQVPSFLRWRLRFLPTIAIPNQNRIAGYAGTIRVTFIGRLHR
jgi:hypothetical protein